MKTALIFAEDEYTRDTLKAALCNHIPLIVTENMVQCLEALHQKAPVYKTIMGISGMNDLDVASAIEEISALKPEMKIIIVGHKNDERMAVESVRHGANGYLLLPIKADELLTTMRQ
ncbi:MAG: response regulator [Candidatus Omnitrophota bacterium]